MSYTKVMIYAGVLLGILGALALISKHPILIGIEILGAILYFAGKSLDKE